MNGDVIHLKKYKPSKKRNKLGNVRCDTITHCIALIILILYGAIQIRVLQVSTPEDDIISARMQDIAMLVLAAYFGTSLPRRKS